MEPATQPQLTRPRKSQLAIEYCYRVRDRSPQAWIFWVHASNAARLEQGYRDIAEAVKIPSRNDPKADIFQLVRNWLRDEKNGKWVIVFDNVDHVAVVSAILPCLPSNGTGSALITSRSVETALNLVEHTKVIQIAPMEKDDATRLFEKKFGTESDDARLAELLAVLKYMPLAVVQAAAYIKQRAPRYSLQQYLVDFHKSDNRRTSLLNHEVGQLRRDLEAKNSILITWQISFDLIRDT
jgi:hypothetical protein